MLGLDLNERDGPSGAGMRRPFDQRSPQPGARARAGLTQRAGSGRTGLGKRRPAGALHKNSRFLVKGQSFRSGKNYSRELPAPIHIRTPMILPATAWRLWFGEEKRSPTNPSAFSDYVQRN